MIPILGQLSDPSFGSFAEGVFQGAWRPPQHVVASLSCHGALGSRGNSKHIPVKAAVAAPSALNIALPALGSSRLTATFLGSSSQQHSTQLPARFITNQIADATSIEVLHEVLQSSAAHLDHIHVAAALSKLVKLQKQGHLAAAGTSHAKKLQSQQQQAAWNSWLQQPQQQPELEQQQQQQQQRQWLGDHTESRPLEAFAYGGFHHEPSSTRDLLKAMLLSLTWTHLQSMGSRQLPVVLYSLAKLGWNDQPKLLKQLLQACPPLFYRFTPQGLTNILYACALLGVRPAKKWLQLWFRACRRGLCVGQLNTQDLTMSSWALGRLGVYPKDEWQADFLATCQVRPGLKVKQAYVYL